MSSDVSSQHKWNMTGKNLQGVQACSFVISLPIGSILRKKLTPLYQIIRQKPPNDSLALLSRPVTNF